MARVKYTSGVGVPWGATKKQGKINAEIRQLHNANTHWQNTCASLQKRIDDLVDMLPGPSEIRALKAIERLPFMTLCELDVLAEMVELTRWARRMDVTKITKATP